MALTDKLSAIADAIRAKTGKNAPMTLEQMPGEISGITTGGGGSSADVRYVTFMNGNTVLYRKPVAVGDDCVNVLTKGLIETPTKESTVQYNYTYYGWGAADNGAADSTILQNITEDKTVYAIYTATVRTYTITYYDSDGTTVLKTETLAYGATPSYSPKKAEHLFMGWLPAVSTVTGNAAYAAQWRELKGEPFGNNCRWSLEDGVLTITGNGDMPSYTNTTYTERPWQDQVEYITSVVIADGVTNIGDRTFHSMPALAGVEIADSVTSIGAAAFYNCSSLTSITIPDGVTSVGGSVFNGTAITSIIIPDSVTSFESFMNNVALKNIVIGNGVTTIPANCFQGCTALESIVIGNSVTMLPGNMFSRCAALTSLTIPDSVTEIGAYLCGNSGITSLTIPDSVTKISANAFANANALAAVTFEDTSGWYLATSSVATSGTNITLGDPATNATYLKTTYKNYWWFNT